MAPLAATKEISGVAVPTAVIQSARPAAQASIQVKLTVEAARKIVVHLYRELLGRAAEPSNLEGVAGGLVSGRISIRSQIMSMIKSEEFQRHALAEKSAAEISDQLFQMLLGRQPSEPERAEAARTVAEQGYRTLVDVLATGAEYMNRFGNDKLPLF